MSAKHPDDRVFEFTPHNAAFDAELEYGQRERRRGGCCGCGCCFGCLGLVVLIVLGIAALGYCLVIGGAPLVVSEETTVITEPLKPDGTVDFHQAIQKMIEPDVQPDENGFMTVWRGYGKEIFDSIHQTELRRHYLVMCEQFGIDPQAPATWVDAGEGLDAVQTAVAGPHYFIPLVRQSENDLVAMSQPLALYAFHERLSDMLRQRADVRFDADDIAGGWQDILTTMRLFRRVTAHQAWITEIGERDNETRLTLVSDIVNTLPNWTPQQLEQAVRDLETLPDWQDRQTMLKTLQFMMLDMLSVTNDFPGLGNRLGVEMQWEDQMMLEWFQHVGIDWNLFAKELNHEMKTYGELMDRISGNPLEEQFSQLRLRPVGTPFRMPDDEDEWRAFTINHLERTGEFPLFTSGRSRLIGATIGHLGTWVAGEMYRLQLIEESRCQALRLALALERFHRTEDRYPQSLEELRLQPMPWDMHLQYERRGEGYRMWNRACEITVH